MPMTHPAYEELRSRLSADWPAISKAAVDAEATRARMRAAFGSGSGRVHSDDASVIVFGSLARDEWTSGSDIDWTLLIDGQADPEHLKTAHWIAGKLDDLHLAKPGISGVFGNMAFSHEIIHQIGGQSDTNRNTTQRVLLLLESAAIGSAGAYERVLRGILNRYLEDDPGLMSTDQQTRKLPRFLLNDVVRFWRTMAVDYASKQRERSGQGWALRNIKLRMSRKLVFVKGLLVCFNCILKGHEPASAAGGEQRLPPLVSYLGKCITRSPLDMVSEAWLDHYNDASARRMFDSYDEFLSTLNHPEQRERLKSMKPGEAATDELFQRLRRRGHEFQESITDLFFKTDRLAPLTAKFGVF